MKIIKASILVLALMMLIGSSVPGVLGQTTTVCPPGQIPNAQGVCGVSTAPTTVQGLIDLVNRVFGLLFVIVITLSSVFILWAAFLYVTARGDADKQGQAKTILIYAVVGLIVAALAWGVPKVVQNFITP
ncbi:MAG TPA: hypothetical protein VI432_00405 [Candidatus Paceibacterota bacterium]